MGHVQFRVSKGVKVLMVGEEAHLEMLDKVLDPSLRRDEVIKVLHEQVASASCDPYSGKLGLGLSTNLALIRPTSI